MLSARSNKRVRLINNMLKYLIAAYQAVRRFCTQVYTAAYRYCYETPGAAETEKFDPLQHWRILHSTQRRSADYRQSYDTTGRRIQAPFSKKLAPR